MGERDDLGSDEIEAFATAMWGADFAVSVTWDQVPSFRTPMLMLPGVDEHHPAETGREIGASPPGCPQSAGGVLRATMPERLVHPAHAPRPSEGGVTVLSHGHHQSARWRP
jgi:hypothetical protein